MVKVTAHLREIEERERHDVTGQRSADTGHVEYRVIHLVEINATIRDERERLRPLYLT